MEFWHTSLRTLLLVGLEKLTLCCAGRVRDDVDWMDFTKLPPILKRLTTDMHNDRTDWSHFPASLLELHLCYIFIEPRALRHLPPNITKLKNALRQPLDTEVARSLHSLTELREMVGFAWLPILPQGIRRMTIRPMVPWYQVDNDAVDLSRPEELEIPPPLYFPLTHLALFAQPQLLLTSLPPSLKSLQVGHYGLTPEIMQSLPRQLTKFKSTRPDCLSTDLCFQHLILLLLT